MKKLYIFALLIVLSLSALAGPVDEATARQLAQNFWIENNIMAVRGGKVFANKTEEAQFVNVGPRHGYTEFFIFNNTRGKGYVIMAADDCVIPVLGYSYENNFDIEVLPPNVKALLDDYAKQIRDAVTMKVAATEEIRSEWACLRDNKPLPIKSETAVGPLVSTKWNQSPYYNALCPYDNAHNARTLTGCVATAMAQVMKYWNYPEHGYGSHSYTPASHPEYGSLYVDFSAVNYQWSQMPNSVSSNNNAVATLMYHCGVSVNMDYGISGSPDYGSAAYVIDNGNGRACAEIALRTYFDYKSSLRGVKRSNYSDSQWINLLKNELDNSRPMVYAGFGSGGHAFVCDGYNNNDYFHFNWGWGGQCDDYFYINNLNPGSSHNYSENQQAIIGIEPNHSGGGGGGGSGNYSLKYHSSVTMEDYSVWFYDPLKVYAEIINSGSGNFSGYIGAGIFRKDENNKYRFMDVIDYWNRTSNPLQPNYYVYGHLESEGGPPYIPGAYAIAMLYSMDGDLWNFIEGNNYSDAFFDIVYSSDIETYSDFTIQTGEFLYYGISNTVNVDIWNSGSETFYGKFRVNLANADGSWAQNIQVRNCSNGLQAGYHYTNGLNFTGEITVEPGTYYMELAYQKSGSSNWYYAGAYRYQNPIIVEVTAPSVSADQYEANNTASSAYSLSNNFSSNSGTLSTPGSNLHNGTDVDYYKIHFGSGTVYTVTPRLHDSYNSGNGTYYTVDGKFSYSTDGNNWSEYYDDVLPSSISVAGGSTLYFCVMPYFEGKTGTYLLDIHIVKGTGVDENGGIAFDVFPNPTSDFVTISGDEIEEVKVFNTLGVMVKSQNTNGEKTFQIDLSALPDGLYMLQAINGEQAVVRHVVKTK